MEERRSHHLPPLIFLALLAGFSGAPAASQPPPVAFAAGRTFDLGGPDTRALLVGDFDGDGRPDLSATLFRDTEDDGLVVLFGDGNAGFPRRISFAAGFRAYGLAACDFNGDGRLDLASTEGTQVKPSPRPPCGSPISVPVFLNSAVSPGTFYPEACLASGTFPIAAVARDFDGDGHADLAVVDNVGDDVTLFLGAGDGSFSAGASTGPLVSGPTSIASGDFDRDGHPDIALGHQDAFVGHGVTVLLGNGLGAFGVRQTVPSGSSVQALRAADVNGDGILDLLAADKGGGRVWVCLGRGDGTFRDGTAFPAGSYPNDLEVADLNGDGVPDVAVANSGSDDVSILLGTGDGSFVASPTVPAGHEPQGVVVADFDGDGRPDIAVSARNAGEQGSVSLLLQMPSPRALPGDCDGDGAVSIGEVQRAIGMFLELQPTGCSVDCSGDGKVSIGEVQKVIGCFLGLTRGC